MIELVAPPDELTAATRCLRDLPIPWAFAGGWALDLWLGRVTRKHSDIDVAVLREDQTVLRAALVGWNFEVVEAGMRRPWPADEWLSAPWFETHASPPTSDAPGLEFLLGERDGSDWVFRRNPAVRCPLSQAFVHTSSGLRVLAPEIVLLFKAKVRHAHDESDFAAVWPKLGADSRAWLADSLRLWQPGHPWRFVLTQGAAEPP